MRDEENIKEKKHLEFVEIYKRIGVLMYMYFEHDVCIFLVSTPISFYTQYYEYSHVAVSYDIIIGEWKNKKKTVRQNQKWLYAVLINNTGGITTYVYL